MSRSKVILSDAIWSWQFQRGIARYFSKVVEAVVSEFEQNATIISAQNLKYGQARHVRPFYINGRSRLNHLLQDATASVASLFVRVDLFYSPFFGNAKIAAPQVFTVYDMIPELQSGYFDRLNESERSLINEKKRCLERAEALIAISQQTARDIVSCYPQIDATKIRVIHLGVDDYFFQDTKCAIEDGWHRPYFVYVGHRSRYKNFLRLLVAYGRSSLARDFDLLVLSPTSEGWANAELNIINEYALHDRVVLQTNLADDELRNAYRNSIALVYPSECEGFGLPILEAMACGTLVIAADRAPMTEVGGDHALYFDPLSVTALTESLRAATRMSDYDRQFIIQRGKEWAREFSWAECQRQTIGLFRQFV